ncbi:pimeloyl-ACP methyl ester esterase BioH [Thiofilum flexile]|uniref:pimeloyl-ACP methyl ester esterase BioH n=1 Tax=Thiofilum flexile TaxID=125627 RepID=UPI0003612B6A|nr:pimeloyl-ACP methyl ester esterase BioH [Thiofilum flexile]
MSQIVLDVDTVWSSTEGQGRPLLVLHGWGMNQAAWQPIRAHLTQHARVTWVDLPGHGRSAVDQLGTLEQLVQTLKPLIQPNTAIIGWSLGGLLAQALAYAMPDKVARLLLIGSSPCFIQTPTWPHALAPEVLEQFATNLETDYVATVKRFFALQFMGTRHSPVELNQLRDAILQYPARLPALHQGLELLRSVDFSEQTLPVPSRWILGRLDKLVPVAVAEVLEHKGYEVKVLPHASHVPFVTHTEEFLAAVEPFIYE